MPEPNPEQIEWYQNFMRHGKRRMVLGTFIQLSVLVGFAVLLVRSHSSAKQLLLTAGTWLIVVFSWLALVPSAMWGWKVKTRSRAERALVLGLVYGNAMLYQLFLYGWLIPLGVGIYRAVRS